MKILVTGATGFIGSHLCELLVRNGHEVFAQARNKEKFDSFNVPGKLILGSLNHKSSNSWIKQLPEDLDVVIHTAGQVHSFRTKNFYDTNTRATSKLIEDLKEKYHYLHFCLISSLAAAGPSKDNTKKKEEDICRPVSYYGDSKYIAEIALEKEAPDCWIKTIVRPPIVIGPRDPGFLDVFKMVKQRVIFLSGIKANQNQYSFVAVYDLINIIYQSVLYNKQEGSPEIFYGCHPEKISYKDLTSSIEKSLQKEAWATIPVPIFILWIVANIFYLIDRIIPFINLDIKLTPDKVSELSKPYWLCSSDKSQTKLDYSYEWNLQRIIDATLSDYKGRNWL